MKDGVYLNGGLYIQYLSTTSTEHHTVRLYDTGVGSCEGKLCSLALDKDYICSIEELVHAIGVVKERQNADAR